MKCIERVVGPDHRVSYILTMGSWLVDTRDWSLSRREPRHDSHAWEQLFSLKCILCGRFSIGCGEHWFCGICEPCKSEAEQ